MRDLRGAAEAEAAAGEAMILDASLIRRAMSLSPQGDEGVRRLARHLGVPVDGLNQKQLATVVARAAMRESLRGAWS